MQTKALSVCETTGLVYTGDWRGAIRRWNLQENRSTLSEYLAGPQKSSKVEVLYHEKSGTTDIPSVIYESKRSLVGEDIRVGRQQKLMAEVREEIWDTHMNDRQRTTMWD